MRFARNGAAAVLEHQAVVAAVERLAQDRLDAAVGGDPGEHQVLDAALPEVSVDAGRAEGAIGVLVEDRLAGERRDLGDDLPARLAADEAAAERAAIADDDEVAAGPAPGPVGLDVGEIGGEGLARVDATVKPAPRIASSTRSMGASGALIEVRSQPMRAM